jgi:DNA mismatch repair protein MutS
VEEPPVGVKDGYLIRTGVSDELDELIRLTTDTQELLLKMEALEKGQTGISSLKIKYNNVFGYSIEVTNAHKAKVPSHYRRRQTLAQAERYTTDELETLENKILTARTRRLELESAIFEELRQKVLSEVSLILEVAQKMNQVDVATGLAWLAIEASFCRPEFVEDSEGISLKSSRHPVVEKLVARPFVSNDIELEKGECLLLTGPNMAGKSTLMRQVALTVILAQIGSYVPATQAKLPIFEKLFTRIGASDSLSEGLSTFMVEMKETAEMLLEADSKSLVILDEVGRGTSTYDGMSLAQAILEHMVSDVKSTTLFATHYQELAGLSNIFGQIKNAHMGIREKGGVLSFLYTLQTGPASRSYGIHVAELAGLPREVIQRAEKILSEKESERLRVKAQMSLFENAPKEPEASDEKSELLREIHSLEIEKMTPIEALLWLSKFKEKRNQIS